MKYKIVLCDRPNTLKVTLERETDNVWEFAGLSQGLSGEYTVIFRKKKQ
jgi:hypothetical protein